MTISNQRGCNEILQPAVSVDQAQNLSEIYDHHESKAVFHLEGKFILQSTSYIPYLFGYKTGVSPLQNDYK